MKARQHALSIATLAVLVATGPLALGAQARPVVRQQPRADTPRLMVQVFGSADKVAGPAASDELRQRLIYAVPARILWVHEKQELINLLEQSGYPVNEQLPRADEAQVAKMVRADEYIRGNVTRQGENYKVEAYLVLTRDNSLTQPLPAVEANKPDKAAAGLVRSITEARKQLDNEKKCMEAARADRHDEAIAAADAGIVEYPNATLVRYCKLNVLSRRKAPAADIAKMANEILAIDPNSKAALAVGADALKELGNVDGANDLLVRLLATDPTNTSLADRVVNALAASGKFDVAKQVINKAVAENPGDVNLIRLQFLILNASREYKEALRIAEDLVQMDTASATADFFTRLAAIYQADSQPQKAAEAAARGTAKFPNNAGLWQLHAQLLRNSGQFQQSIVSATRALQIDPKLPNGWMQIAIAYNELGQPDSVLMSLRNAKAAGDNPDAVGGYALTIGNRLYRAANAADPKTIPAFQAGLPYLAFADSTVSDSTVRGNAALLQGVSHFFVGQLAATDAPKTKNCELARLADASMTQAQIMLMRGARTAPETAQQLLQYVPQFAPVIAQQVKQFCK